MLGSALCIRAPSGLMDLFARFSKRVPAGRIWNLHLLPHCYGSTFAFLGLACGATSIYQHLILVLWKQHVPLLGLRVRSHRGWYCLLSGISSTTCQTRACFLCGGQTSPPGSPNPLQELSDPNDIYYCQNFSKGALPLLQDASYHCIRRMKTRGARPRICC